MISSEFCPAFFLTLALFTVPAFAAEEYVFPERNCKVCGAAGILNESTSFAPTCVNDSKVFYNISSCGAVVPPMKLFALGHDWIESSRVDATVAAPGSVGYSCSRCSETKTEVFSMACEWMEAVCFTVASHPILLLGVVIGFIGTGAGLFQRLLNL